MGFRLPIRLIEKVPNASLSPAPIGHSWPDTRVSKKIGSRGSGPLRRPSRAVTTKLFFPIASSWKCNYLNHMTLYPKNSNYPDVDFFIWDHQKSRLWAIQVTVQSADQHPNVWFAGNSPHDEWMALLNPIVPSGQKSQFPLATLPKLWFVTTAPDFRADLTNHHFINVCDPKCGLWEILPSLQYL